MEGGNCTSLRADDSVQSTAQETVESEGLREHFIIECSELEREGDAIVRPENALSA